LTSCRPPRVARSLIDLPLSFGCGANPAKEAICRLDSCPNSGKHAKMATLSAVRSNPQIAPFYNRLIKNGKKPIVAARKFIVILNAKIRDIYLKT
jgi:hypothetical protein